MNKQEFKELLESKGYSVVEEDNVTKVVFIMDSQRDIDKAEKELMKLKKESGYNGTFGWKSRLKYVQEVII